MIDPADGLAIEPFDYRPGAGSRIIFGETIDTAVARLCDEFDGRRVSVIGSPSALGDSQLLAQLRTAIGRRLCGIFSDVVMGVTEQAVIDATHFLSTEKPDVVVSVGGGAAIDTAKAAILLYTTGGSVEHHAVRHLGNREFGIPEEVTPIIRHIAVQMTLTGAEVTGGISVTTANRVKVNLVNRSSRPDAVIVDPGASAPVPSKVIAWSGVNALAHCVEGLYSDVSQPISASRLIYAGSVLFRDLAASAIYPKDWNRRGRVLIAALLSSSEFASVGAGIVHAATHALTGDSTIPHGWAYGVLLPSGLRFNAPAISQRALSDLGDMLGIQASDSVPTAERCAHALEGFMLTLDAPTRLRDLGVPRQDLPRLAEDTMRHYAITHNPRWVSSSVEVSELFEACW